MKASTVKTSKYHRELRQFAISFPPEGNLTEQSHRDDLNINNILKKFQKTGVIDHVKEHGATYGDVPAQDFREAQEIITTASSMFEELPSRARKHFDNDPAKFLEAMQNPDTKTETLHKIGLLNPDYTPPNATEEHIEAQKGSEATSPSEGGSDAPASGEG